MLRAGSSVQEVAAFYSEPATNVYAVQRAMARDATPAPQQRPRNLASVPTSASTPPVLSIDALVSAASRSESKRTKALGAKLEDLAAVVRERLAAERDAAERVEREKAEREAAAAEVAELEQKLAAAKAKLRPGRVPSGAAAGGSSSASGSARPAYPGGPAASVIRSWAKSAGVDCPAFGRVPQPVIDAYRERHQ